MKRFHDNIVCTYLYAITKWGYPPPADTTRDFLRAAHDLGFASVEIEGIRENHLRSMYEQRHETGEALRYLGLNVPFFCTVLPGLSSFDEQERGKNLELFELGCTLARRLGAVGVLDNGPLPPYQFPADVPLVRHYDQDVILAAPLPPGLTWSSYWEALVETIREACDIASRHHLTYHVHPALGVLANTADGFLYLFDAVRRDNLRFVFDTANQHVFKENLTLALHRLREYVDYIHISDSAGSHIEHLNPGNGSIHWETFFQTLSEIDFHGYLGIDIGGDESNVEDLDAAYRETATWLEATIERSGIST